MDATGAPPTPGATTEDRVVIPLPSLGSERARRVPVPVGGFPAVMLRLAGWSSSARGRLAIAGTAIAAAPFTVAAP